MTESPFVKAEGPELTNVVNHLGGKHLETMAKLDDAILEQLKQQSFLNIPENTATISVEGRDNMFTADPRSGYYYREQMQPDRAEVHRLKTELAHILNRQYQATDEISRLTQVVQRAESRLFDAYQLIGQLIGYLDSIEWGTHDEWTRSQSLRERAHEYLTGSNTIAT